MLTDADFKNLTLNGEISQSELKALFATLDKAGVGALWVDKNFEHYYYNRSQVIIKQAVEDSNGKHATYKDLLPFITNRVDNSNVSNISSDYLTKNWIGKLREKQAQPMVIHDDHIFLAKLGAHFISRRVFLNDGSMLAINLHYDHINNSNALKLLAFNKGKSGAICYNLSDKTYVLESPYLQRILTHEELSNIENKGIFALIHPEDVQSAKSVFKRSLLSTQPTTHNLRILTKNNGNLWMKHTGQMVKDENGVPYQHLTFFEDITEELKIQDDLRQNVHRSNAELKDRLDFMAKLSHELKTPMNAIVGISDALTHRNDVTDDVKSKLDIILSSSEALVSMLDDTLSHAKLRTENTSLNLQPLNPIKVIGDICKLWEHQALKKGTKIRFEIDPNIPSNIMADKQRLTQCLNNLISNAAKFTEYGIIDVILKLHTPENHPQQLAIVVRDNGIGMTQDQLGRIFEAYKQADETISSRFGGTGLGMNITKDLVELMGGKITVKSAPNKGSLFLITLPVKQDTPVVSEPAQDNTPPPIGERVVRAAPQIKKPAAIPTPTSPPTPSQRLMQKLDVSTSDLEKLNILVVDDNETNHVVMSSLLESVVGKIYSAYNGQEALNTLKIEHIDIVLMDIHMPVMDGIEATIAIRSNPEIYPQVRIIALTADPQFQQKRLCVNIGMDEAMAKPVRLVDLIETIKKTLSSPVNTLSKAAS